MPPKSTPSETAPAAAPAADRHSRELDLLGEISRLLDHTLDLREVADPMLEALSAQLGLEYATLTLLNRKTGDILIEAAHGLSAQQAQRGRYRLGEGVTGKVVQDGQPIVIPARANPRCSSTRPGAASGRTPRSSACRSRSSARWPAPSARTGPAIPPRTCSRTCAC